jgi:hypothetical protein
MDPVPELVEHGYNVASAEEGGFCWHWGREGGEECGAWVVLAVVWLRASLRTISAHGIRS